MTRGQKKEKGDIGLEILRARLCVTCASPGWREVWLKKLLMAFVSAMRHGFVAMLWDWVNVLMPPFLTSQCSLPASLRAMFKIKRFKEPGRAKHGGTHL